MKFLVFDTETTGVADFKSPPEDPCQPRIAQLGAILYQDNLTTKVVEMNCIVQPFGFEIPIEESCIHGITQKQALADGLPEPKVLQVFTALADMADVLVAHNITYDVLVLQRALHVHKVQWNFPIYKCECTMKKMTPVCKLPARWKTQGDYKWPSLQEAYTHVFQKRFEGAHDAMADVRACAEVFFWHRARLEAGEVGA